MYLGSFCFWLCQLVRKSPRAAWTMTSMTCHWKQGLNMPEIDVRNKETPRGRREFFFWEAKHDSIGDSVGWISLNSESTQFIPIPSLVQQHLPLLVTQQKTKGKPWQVELKVEEGPDAYVTDSTVGRSLGHKKNSGWNSELWFSFFNHKKLSTPNLSRISSVFKTGALQFLRSIGVEIPSQFLETPNCGCFSRSLFSKDHGVYQIPGQAAIALEVEDPMRQTVDQTNTRSKRFAPLVIIEVIHHPYKLRRSEMSLHIQQGFLFFRIVSDSNIQCNLFFHFFILGGSQLVGTH